MATLADINSTLQQQLVLMAAQETEMKKTSHSVESLKTRIADLLNQRKSEKLDTLEKERESRSRLRKTSPTGFGGGLAEGSGASALMSFLSSAIGGIFGRGGGLLGMLTGALGLVAGKLIKWSVIGGLIATFMGDEIMSWAATLKDWTGIDLVAAFNEHPLLYSALGFLIAEMVAVSLIKGTAAVAKWGIGAALAGIGSLFGFGKGKESGKPPKSTTPKPAPGTKPGGKPSKVTPAPSSKSPKLTPSMRNAMTAYDTGKLPQGFARNAAGQVYDKATGKFAKVSDVVDAIKLEQVSKYAKYTKLLKFLGAAGSVFAAGIDPAMAIYSGASDDEVRKQLAGALGSLSGAALGAVIGAAGVTAIPGVGQTGIANIIGGLGGAVVGSLAGEWLVEKLVDHLMGAAPSAGNNVPKNSEELSAATNEFSGMGSLDIPTNPAPAKVAPAPRKAAFVAPSRASVFAKPSSSGSQLQSTAPAAGGVTVNNFYGGPGGSSSGGSAVPIPVPAVAAYTVDLMDGGGRRYGPQ